MRRDRPRSLRSVFKQCPISPLSFHMTFTPVKAVALLVFIGAIAGATYGVQTLVGDSLAKSLVAAEPLHEARNATAGNEVTFPFTLSNRDDAGRDVRIVVEGEGIDAQSELARVPGDGGVTVFVRVGVPASLAPGDHDLSVRLVDEAGETVRADAATLRLRVLDAPTAGFGPTDVANMTYTGRLAETGTVFVSNDAALAGEPFARVEDFRLQSGSSRLAQGLVVPGLYEGALGMVPGESRTIVVSPEKGYGNATLETTQPREETIERISEFPVVERSEARQNFDQHVIATNQGDPASFEAGDSFTVYNEQTANTARFEITEIDEQIVKYRFAPQLGDTYTLYPAWLNQSVITAVNETSVTFETTPSTDVDEPFTWYEHWRDASTIVSMNETEIVVRHSPAIGSTHEEPDPFRQETRRLTVSRLTDDEIVMTYPSSSALAGKTIVYDVTLTSIQGR